MKRNIFSTQLLKEVYLSKTCFLFIDEERVSIASPVATGIINTYDMEFWEQIKDHRRTKLQMQIGRDTRHLCAHFFRSGIKLVIEGLLGRFEYQRKELTWQRKKEFLVPNY